MEYGIWLSYFGSRSNFHTLRECRHHGLQEFIFNPVRGKVSWTCIECKKQRDIGVLARLEPYRRMDMEGRIIKCCSKLKEKDD